MLIEKEVLAEKNYTGSRLIEITDKMVKKLQAEVAKFAPLAKPHLDKLEELGKVLDPARIKIREIQEKAKKDVEDLKATYNVDLLKDQEAKEIEALDVIDQKAQLVKNKMQPIINDIIKGQIGEFEVARHMKTEGDKMFVEVFDEIEEKVKQIRALKANKK